MTAPDPGRFEALEPEDDYNRKLGANVHPTDWVNPKPRQRYHLVVIGAGTAGLVTAAIAAALGARVALIEEKLMGGDCLNVGCVPSKALIRSSRAAVDTLGPDAPEESAATAPDFPAAMERMRRIRSEISVHDSAQRYSEMGVDVYLGSARFLEDGVVEVGGVRLKYRKAVIATGTRAAVPDIRGLESGRALTNETIFTLTELPARLLIIGGGAIGCELSQAFARLGSKVTLLESGPRILAKDDPEAASVVHAALIRSGVEIVLDADVQRASYTNEWTVSYTTSDGVVRSADADELLIAAGRTPNVERLGLEQVGVAFDARRGVQVDDYLRTTNSRIYAIGDVASAARFTHVADAHARMVVRNALFFGRGKVSNLVIPWCTYTSPELAHVGMSVAEVERRRGEIESVTIPFASVDRAKLDGSEEGFLRVHLKKGSDKILGATLVGEHAGDIISQITQAMISGNGLGKLGSAIYPYPTRAEIVRKAADAWQRQKLTPTAKRAFQLFFRVTR